jgi:hypothetical protein
METQPYIYKFRPSSRLKCADTKNRDFKSRVTEKANRYKKTKKIKKKLTDTKTLTDSRKKARVTKKVNGLKKKSKIQKSLILDLSLSKNGNG